LFALEFNDFFKRMSREDWDWD